MWVGASWERRRPGGSWIEGSLYNAIPQQSAGGTPAFPGIPDMLDSLVVGIKIEC